MDLVFGLFDPIFILKIILLIEPVGRFFSKLAKVYL